MKSYQATSTLQHKNANEENDDGYTGFEPKNSNRNQIALVLMATLLVVSLVAVAVPGSSGASSSGSPHSPAAISMKITSGGNPRPHFRDASREVDGVTMLYQSDFKDGTVRLTTADKKYKLAEDIVFEPNPSGAQKNEPGAFLPDFSQQSQKDEYDAMRYVLGFFSCITIEAANVELDLNGKTIAQSRTFYLMQRVYAHITLADSPFIMNHGPNDFGGLNGATGCTVKNGKLGLSSHHGIHGNEANGCTIQDMEIIDFELAGIHQNNVMKLTVKNVVVGPPLAPPIRGPFFQARMLLEFFRNFVAADAKEKKIKFSGRPPVSAKQVFERLQAGLDLTFDWFVNGNEFARNDPKYDPEFEAKDVQEGSSIYGIVINGIGPAVTGIGFTNLGESDEIMLEDVSVRGLATSTREVVSVVEPSAGLGEISVGPTGEQVDVFRWSNYQAGSQQKIDDLKYIGNIRSDALFALNEYCLHLTDLSATPFRISDMLRNWAMDGKAIENPNYMCNGDAQFHVIKGVFGIRIEGTTKFTLKNVKVSEIESNGDFGSNLCGPYVFSHPESAQTFGYGGTAAYGISITNSEGTIRDTSVSDVMSKRGVAFGIVVWQNSKVTFEGSTRIERISALGDGQPVAELGQEMPEPSLTEQGRLPNRSPEACGLDVRGEPDGGTGASTVVIMPLGQGATLKSQCLTSPLVCKRTTLPNFGQTMKQCGAMANLSPPSRRRGMKKASFVVDGE